MKKWCAPLFLLSAILFTVCGYYNSVIYGTLKYVVDTQEYKDMYHEIILCLVIFTIGFRFTRIKQVFALIGVITFAYLHQIILPALSGVVYFIFIIELGNYVLNIGILKCDKMDVKRGMEECLVVGSAVVIILIAALSLLNIGSIKNIQILFVLMAVILLIDGFRKKRGKLSCFVNSFKYMNIELNLIESVALSAIFVAVLIQLGRANICVDYDSAWYGVRSQYVLNAGNGIYENLYLLGFTYLYQKGFEIITLPLCNLDSIAYIYTFNIMFGVSILVTAGKLLSKWLSKTNILLSLALLASIPGIFNMTVTGKSDIATLVFQIIAIYFWIEFIEKKQLDKISLAIASILFSYNFKTTSILFSSIIILAATVSYIFIKVKDNKKTDSRFNVRVIIISLLATFAVCYRTFVLTGVPMIAYYARIMEKLGFNIEAKYPYKIYENINEGGVVGKLSSVSDIFVNMGKRLYAYFISPSSYGNTHIIIAWGGPAIVFLVSFIVICVILRRFKDDNKLRYMMYMYIFILLGSIFAISYVSQMDGNYLMLLYCTTIILASIYLKTLVKNAYIKSAIIICIAANILITSMSNWAWANGFSEIRLFNKGYINQLENYEQDYIQKYGKGVLEIINSNKENRVIAFVDDVLLLLNLHCVSERYLDLVHYGNPEVANTLETFLEYLKLAKINYLYIEDTAITPASKAENLILGLIEEGYIDDIETDKGHKLLHICYDNNLNRNINDLYMKYNNNKINYISGIYEDGWVEQECNISIYTNDAQTLEFEIYALSEEKLQVYVNDQMLDNKVILQKGDSSFRIQCTPNAILRIKIQSNYSEELTPPDVRVCSYLLKEIKFIN